MPMPSKPRILCLHGFTSNGAVHAHQARRITSALSTDYDFLFPDGPHIVPGADVKDQSWHDYVSSHSSAGHRAWWFARDSNLTNANSFVNPETGGYYGMEESLKYLGEMIQRDGPVHAVWGFSQGACLAGMLMALLCEQSSSDPLGLKKYVPATQKSPMAGVFFGGFKARFKQYGPIYENGIEVPTLHVVGTNDMLVSMERSDGLVAVCEQAEVLKHANGHNLPREEVEVERVVGFLSRNVK